MIEAGKVRERNGESVRRGNGKTEKKIEAEKLES